MNYARVGQQTSRADATAAPECRNFGDRCAWRDYVSGDAASTVAAGRLDQRGGRFGCSDRIRQHRRAVEDGALLGARHRFCCDGDRVGDVRRQCGHQLLIDLRDWCEGGTRRNAAACAGGAAYYRPGGGNGEWSGDLRHLLLAARAQLAEICRIVAACQHFGAGNVGALVDAGGGRNHRNGHHAQRRQLGAIDAIVVGAATARDDGARQIVGRIRDSDGAMLLLE